MTKHCAQCGAVLPVDMLAGHCPACLVHTALEADSTAAQSERSTAFPHSFGDYELLEEVARGGMGVVYRARQRSLNRQVAIKMILAGEFASPEFVRRFRHEATAAASLQHPNIVAIHEVGEANGRHYFSMDLVEGRNLDELVRDQALPARRAAGYVKTIAEAVRFAHEKGILHRDLKPSNILIDAFDQPRITDFGLAKEFRSGTNLTQSGQTLGSPAYMPPEQAAGRHAMASPASDLYSLGAILYHLLTGRPPFQGETLHQVLLQVQGTEPIAPRRLNPGVPEDLQTICLKCLEKEPEKRYASATDLADDLGRFLEGQPVNARPVGPAGKLLRWCRRRPAVASLAGSVALLLIALAVAASVAAWRIDLARRAEHGEREKALQANTDLESANTRLGETVTFLELQRAEALFRSGDASMGLAHLAAVLRRDPSNRAAAARILLALLHRNWVLPGGAPLQHPLNVNSVAYSPSGQHVVTGCADRFARIWDVRTRQEIGIRLEHPDQVRGACFSPDETRIATACGDGTVRIWDWRTTKTTAGPVKHGSRVLSVSFSPDGERVLSASGDRTARVWSARTGKLLLTLVGHGDDVWQAVFSPDGQLIATASLDGSARLWDSQTGQSFGPVLRHGLHATGTAFGVAQSHSVLHEHFSFRAMLGVAFSPDGSWLATPSRDRTAVVWNVDTGAPLSPAFQHPAGLNDVQFDPAGRIIVTTAFDNTIRLWDARSGEILSQPFRHREQANRAAFSPDGRILATASDDWTVKFWDVLPGETLKEPIGHSGPEGDINWVEFSRDGRALATASFDHTARVWDGQTGLPISGPLQHRAPVWSASFSPDGRFVVTASADHSAWIWETRTGNRVKGPFSHDAGLWVASFSPEGRRLVTAAADKTARVWDIDSKKPITPPLQHQGEVFMARFSPDGTRVVTASGDNTARVWNAENGAPITKGLLHLDKVRDAHFSPDGRLVATAARDNTARIWNARSGEPIGRPLHHLRTVEAVAFSPDGRRLVTASMDHTARIWDAATGEPLSPPLEHDESVLHAGFSPDGERVVTASIDRSVRIWDAKTGVPLSDPLWHEGPVRMAQFSPDGERVVTGALAPGNSACIWQVPAASSPIPDWLPALAEAMAGVAVGAQGTTRLVSEGDLDQLRERLNDLTDNGAFSRVARWFFADRTARTISPFQSGTVAEYVQRRIVENTVSSLEEAVRLDPTNSFALARLAKAVLPSDPAKEPRRAAEAAHLAKRALRFAPDHPEAREVLERASR